MRTINKTFYVGAVIAAMTFAGAAWADECTTIKDGGLIDSAGNPITVGYDDWGYNYQAHMYNGDYCDVGRGAVVCPTDDEPVHIEGPGVHLLMKWNEAWLSNQSCDGDEILDRRLGSNTYIGSGAWLTNHQSGSVDSGNGKMRKWTYFVKIVAVPEGAVDSDPAGNSGVWSKDGIDIGPEIWGQFAIVQEVLNDPSSGAHGILYKSPSGPGLGNL